MLNLRSAWVSWASVVSRLASGGTTTGSTASEVCGVEVCRLPAADSGVAPEAAARAGWPESIVCAFSWVGGPEETSVVAGLPCWPQPISTATGPTANMNRTIMPGTVIGYTQLGKPSKPKPDRSHGFGRPGIEV